MRNKFAIGDVVNFEGGDSDGDYSGVGTIEEIRHRHLMVAATHEWHGDSMYPGARVLVRKMDAWYDEEDEDEEEELPG